MNLIYNFSQISDYYTVRTHALAKKCFQEDGIDIFQLCASILYHESKSDKKEQYIITIPGPDNNLVMQFPLIIMFPTMNDIYKQRTIPVLFCQIEKEAYTDFSLEFEFYIIPDTLHSEKSTSRISVKYTISEHSKVTKIRSYKLPSPWNFF